MATSRSASSSTSPASASRGRDVHRPRRRRRDLRRQEAGVRRRKTFVQAPSAQRETLISTGQVQMIVATYSINDARKEKVSFAGPYFVAGQDLLVRSDDTSITGPDALNGKKLCSVTGSTSAQKIKDQYADVHAAAVRHLLGVRHGAGQRGHRRPDDRQHHPAGLRRAGPYKGKLKVVGKPFSDGELRHRPEEGRHRPVHEDQRGDRRRWSRTARGRRRWTDNLGPADFKVDGAVNPPTPGSCS